MPADPEQRQCWSWVPVLPPDLTATPRRAIRVKSYLRYRVEGYQTRRGMGPHGLVAVPKCPPSTTRPRRIDSRASSATAARLRPPTAAGSSSRWCPLERTCLRAPLSRRLSDQAARKTTGACRVPLRLPISPSFLTSGRRRTLPSSSIPGRLALGHMSAASHKPRSDRCPTPTMIERARRQRHRQARGANPLASPGCGQRQGPRRSSAPYCSAAAASRWLVRRVVEWPT